METDPLGTIANRADWRRPVAPHQCTWRVLQEDRCEGCGAVTGRAVACDGCHAVVVTGDGRCGRCFRRRIR